MGANNSSVAITEEDCHLANTSVHDTIYNIARIIQLFCTLTGTILLLRIFLFCLKHPVKLHQNLVVCHLQESCCFDCASNLFISQVLLVNVMILYAGFLWSQMAMVLWEFVIFFIFSANNFKSTINFTNKIKKGFAVRAQVGLRGADSGVDCLSVPNALLPLHYRFANVPPLDNCRTCLGNHVRAQLRTPRQKTLYRLCLSRCKQFVTIALLCKCHQKSSENVYFQLIFALRKKKPSELILNDDHENEPEFSN